MRRASPSKTADESARDPADPASVGPPVQLRCGQDISARRVIVQTAFPVLSLNPLEYDDWASVFVGNHIYPRLFPETDREWIPSIAKDVKYQCLDSRRSPTEPCHRERLLLKF